MTCPYCVQYRCVTCKRDFNDSDHWQHDCYETDCEPYWPDGSIAVVTRKTPCISCRRALDDMYRYNREHPA